MSITFYQIFLVLHITGITVMAGTSFIDFVTFRRATIKGLQASDDLDQLQKYLGIGMLLIITSGIGMMAKLHEVWGAQLWFRVKMGVLLLIVLNGLGLRRTLGAKFKKALVASSSALPAISRKLTLVQLIQLFFFAIIYVLSVFKFN
jgi:hypothetical protein